MNTFGPLHSRGYGSSAGSNNKEAKVEGVWPEAAAHSI